jgi:hypothetical protein
MNTDKLITISQYAAAKSISKQAVYKQLNTKLKEYLVEVDGKKYLKFSVLSAAEAERLTEVDQPIEPTFNQPSTNPIQPLLEAQLAEKDKTIESLLKQIEKLQEQNGKLTDLLQNSQVLLAAEKKLYLEATTEPPRAEEPKVIEIKADEKSKPTKPTQPIINKNKQPHKKIKRKALFPIIQRKSK